MLPCILITEEKCAILMALWPIAEILGFAMEQTLNNWKHSVSTLDVLEVKRKAVTPIVPTDNLVLIFFLKKKRVLWSVIRKIRISWFTLVAINCPVQSLVHLHPFIFMDQLHIKLSQRSRKAVWLLSSNQIAELLCGSHTIRKGTREFSWIK